MNNTRIPYQHLCKVCYVERTKLSNYGLKRSVLFSGEMKYFQFGVWLVSFNCSHKIPRNEPHYGRGSHLRCSRRKNVLLENTCARVSFLIKLQGLGLQLY